ncbi:putative calcium-binding protein CML31 [Wolffia australiana]
MAQPATWNSHYHGTDFESSSYLDEECNYYGGGKKADNLLERLFRRVDDNGDGKISPAEVRDCLRAVGEEMTEEEAAAMVELADTDGDGFLSLEDFERLLGEEKEEEEERRRLKEAFEMYVEAEAGCITPRSLRRTLSLLGEVKTIEDCRVMIRRFDLNGDGVLSFDEFDAMMR